MFDARGTSSTLKTNIEITGITFLHDTAYDKGANAYGGVFIAMDYTKSSQVFNCEFTDFNSYAIYAKMIDNNVTEPRSLSICNNSFKNGGTNAVGIFFDQEAEYCIVTNNHFHTIPCAVKEIQAANNKINNNVFLHCGSANTGVIDITCPAQNSGKSIIQGNAINHNMGDGIKITSTFGTGQHGNNISNNEILITLTGFVPIRIIGSKGNMLTNNRLWAGDPTDPGVVLTDNGAQIADYNMIINNMMLNSTIAVTNNSTATKNVISGNAIGISI
jgi:hypothetical protein